MDLLPPPLGRLVLDRLGAFREPVGPQPSRTPSVTVVVPCYNYGHLLPACVESILAQPDVAVDVIIVDDASPDGSVAVARELAAADPRISVIAHEQNKGHIATYNDGLRVATGDYCALLSADDLLTPGALARATALMEAHPSVGFVYGHPVRFHDDELPEARAEATSWTIWPGREWVAARCRTGTNCILSPEVVMRTSLQTEIGGYDPELPHSGDLEMWLRAAALGDVGHIDGADQAYYRLHGANMHTTRFNFGDVSGIMIGLEQRLRAFDAAFAGVAGVLPMAPELHETARRTFASRALRFAARAHLHGRATDMPVDELLAFAAEACPAICTTFEYRTLEAWGADSSPSTYERVRLLAYELTGKAHQATSLARWKLAGV